MKKIVSILLCLIFLVGCSAVDTKQMSAADKIKTDSLEKIKPYSGTPEEGYEEVDYKLLKENESKLNYHKVMYKFTTYKEQDSDNFIFGYVDGDKAKLVCISDIDGFEKLKKDKKYIVFGKFNELINNETPKIDTDFLYEIP